MKNYNFQNDFRMIRRCFGMSQDAFAQATGVSRSNIARYESGQIAPRGDAADRIYGYAFQHGFDLNQSKTMLYEDDRGPRLALYHGCKAEIRGEVDTRHSQPPNDFGDGFYLGQTLNQANMWVAAAAGSSTYCFYFDPEGLRKATFGIDYRWMLAILYFRGALEGYRIEGDLADVLREVDACDYLVAPIADNQMYDTLDLFRNGIISDVACLHALNANNLGLQYVMKTERACRRLEAVDRLYLCTAEREHYLTMKRKAGDDGRSKSLLAISQYRAQGKMFHELFTKEG